MKRKVLLCVLNWGLGHATRSHALLRELESNNCDVILASSGGALAHLKIELPDHVFYELPDYGIEYRNRYSFTLGIAFQLRRIRKAIQAEKITTEQIIKSEHVDIVISDNRYGCYGDWCRNVFVSHQLNIRLSGLWSLLEPAVNFFHRRIVNRFSSVWVPDYPDRLLSGELSSFPHKVTFIGPLTNMRRTEVRQSRYNVLALLSGPEPARSEFSGKLYRQLKNSAKRFLLVEGRPEDHVNEEDRVSHLKHDEICMKIASASLVVARSGYSTIMDMAATGGKAIFVPTPGQTEQLYLARRMKKMGIAFYQEEASFDLNTAVAESIRYKGFDDVRGVNGDLLTEAVVNLLADGKLD